MLHMRKTATFRSAVLATTVVVAQESPQQQALERLLGEPAAVSESARLDQLAYIGAMTVEREAEDAGYAELALYLSAEPATQYRQRSMGAPIVGETDDDLHTLFPPLEQP